MPKTQKNKRKSYWSLALRLAIAAIACWIVFGDLDFAQLARTFRRLNVAVLLLACLVTLLSHMLVGFRWWLVLKAQDIRVPVRPAIRLTLLGHFFSQFMPSSVGGDLVRAWYVSQYADKRLQAALGVAVDRIVGLFATFMLALGSYWLFMRGQDLFQLHRQTRAIGAWHVNSDVVIPLFLAAAFIIAGLVIIVLSVNTFRLMLSRLYRHGVHFLSQFAEVVKVYYHHPAIFGISLVLTLLLQGVVILSYWAVGENLGVDAALRYYFVFFPLVWAFGSIPISIAGLGILEGGVVFLFVRFAGSDPEAAIALALCQRLTWLFAAVPGLWFHIRGAHRGKT